MDASDANDGTEPSKPLNNRLLERNGEAISVIPDSPVPEFRSNWKRESASKRSGRVRRCVRSQSLPACELTKISAGELRRIRERLLRTQRHPEAGPVLRFTRAQKLALVSLGLVDFISFCSMSIMAPFFPREAERKGVSETISGFVFSFYALVMFVSSPFFGKILPQVGAKFLLLAGMFVAGSCNILFGMLAYIDDYLTFIVYCFLVRGLEALGASAYAAASYVFVVDIFPDHIGSVLGLLETFVGVGMSLGPAIGGVLYSVGGYGLPFYTLGIVMVLIVPVSLCLLPPGDAFTVENKPVSVMRMMRIPSVFMICLVLVVVSNTWGFLDPTLEPHLRQFRLTPNQIGAIFLLFSGIYALFSPFWGYLADRVNSHWCMMVWGLLFTTVGLLLLGPSPLLPFLENKMWTNLVALIILGISVSMTLIPTFQAILESAIEGGCSDEMGTYSMVAGIWSSMYSFGEMVGPSLGGVLLEHYGFPWGSTIMACATFALAITTFLFFVLRDSTRVVTVEESTTDSGISDTTGTWEQEQERGNSIERHEDSPLLGSATSEHDLYTREKATAAYYEEDESDTQRAVDIRKTVAITQRGACEV